MLRTLAGASALAFLLGSGPHVRARQANAAQSLGAAEYDEFMQLSVKQRQEQFGRLGGKDQAFLVRTHAERWLAANKAQLSRPEVRIFSEAITFVTPQLYDSPTTLEAFKRTGDIKEGVPCRVRATDAAVAFSVLLGNEFPYPRIDARWNYLSRARCWMGWHSDSVIDYIPKFPR